MLYVLFICVLCEKKYVILYLSLCHSVLQKSPVSLRPSVLLSSKKHLSLFVIMSFCLQKNISLLPSLCYSVFKKNICRSLSLCHSVFKKTSLSFRPSVILSSRPPLLSLLSSCYSVFKITLSTFVFRSLCRPSEDTELR